MGRRDGICEQLATVQKKLYDQYISEKDDPNIAHPLVGKPLSQIVEEGRSTFNWDEACKGRGA